MSSVMWTGTGLGDTTLATTLLLSSPCLIREDETKNKTKTKNEGKGGEWGGGLDEY